MHLRGRGDRAKYGARCDPKIKSWLAPAGHCEWRLELKAREVGLAPCPECMASRKGLAAHRPMPDQFHGRLAELSAYVSLETLTPHSSDYLRYLLRLQQALEVLQSERPPGMVWAGRTGASARWVPNRNGGRVAWMIDSHKGDWPIARLMAKHKPPTVEDLKGKP
jgi:hypothetical protein